MIGARSRSGRRSSSSTRAETASSLAPTESATPSPSRWRSAIIAPFRRSRARLLAASARERRETRTATPKSQLDTDSRRRTVDARRASTRNVAWAASSASWGSPRICRQTRRTVAPCRSTRAENADEATSSDPVVNRSSNSPSVNPAEEPTRNSIRNGSRSRRFGAPAIGPSGSVCGGLTIE
jgi:hypothetical protein